MIGALMDDGKKTTTKTRTKYQHNSVAHLKANQCKVKLMNTIKFQRYKNSLNT